MKCIIEVIVEIDLHSKFAELMIKIQVYCL